MRQSIFLDQFFQNAESTIDEIVKHPRWIAAKAEAEAAYRRTQLKVEQDTPVCGLDPTQAAANAFLQTLGLQANFDDQPG